ncbi:MAG TPA: ATP-binding protein [Candidatus Hydrogenedentes bacterium]|nr:ATP-binding protein [Candidatus Hydrogenedentota bacterium]HQH54469.1 ATP-binding protein [Candidatus Hydrogenedentota bacterium]
MKRAAKCIRENIDAIIEGTLQQVDADACEKELRALLAAVTAALAGAKMPPDLALRAMVDQDDAFVRILCALQAAIIEVLRPALSEAKQRETVLSLRDIFLTITPGLPLMAPCHALRALLEEGPGEESGPKGAQLWKLFEGVLTNTNDMVYAHDVNGVLFFINESGLEMLKYTRGQLHEGLSIYQFVVPDYVDLVEARLESPGAAIRSPYSIEVYARDGSRVPLEIDTHPLFGDEGDVIAVIGVARNLVLERRLQETISRANMNLENLFESLPIGVLLANADGCITNANQTAARLLGARDANTLISDSIFGLWGGEDSAVAAGLREALEKGLELRERFIGKTGHGTPVKCDVLAQPMGHDPEAHGHLILIIDVSEQLELQRSLLQSEKLYTLGELVAGVAHELNNPLTGIIGYAELLMRRELEPEMRDRLDQIAEEAERCRRIVENLLSFGSHHEALKELHDINQLLADTLQLREYQLRISGISIDADYDDAIPPLRVDVNEMRRVFFYLINNAHQALETVKGRPRKLRISTGTEHDRAYIRIEDNGPGIPPEIQPKIFDPFFTTRKFGEATGLGLSVSYGIVKEHGGDIGMKSEPGKGATFTVTLPLPEDDGQDG